MDARQFLTSSRVLIVAGKGGVGKSTISAGLARLGARIGIRTVHVSLDGADRAVDSTGNPATIAISPGRALADYLASRGLGIISRQLAHSGVVELVASTAPGIDDLLVLGKIKSLTKDPANELIVVDGPAAGHALDMLRTPAELRRAVHGGPIAQQADDVLAMLADPSLCRVALVTTPAMTPVTETIESALALRADSGATLACVIVNMCDPEPPPIVPSSLPLDVAEGLRYSASRAGAQRQAIEVLTREMGLAPVRCARHRLDGGDLVAAVTADLESSLTGVGGAP